jgi:hypothetical protein
MRYPIDEKNGKAYSDKGKKPDFKAQARMLEGMLFEKEDGRLNVRNLLQISRNFPLNDAGKKAYDLVFDAGKEPSTREHVVKELISMLPEDADAAILLGRLKAREAVEPLRIMARMDEPYKLEKRDSAIWALGELKAEEAIPECIVGLSDPGLMSTPSKALLKIGEKSIPALIEALSDKTDSLKRRGAAKTLGQFYSDAKEALPALKKLTGLRTRIMDKYLFDAAGHAVFQIEHSASFE